MSVKPVFSGPRGVRVRPLLPKPATQSAGLSPNGREAVIWRRKARPSGEYRLSGIFRKRAALNEAGALGGLAEALCPTRRWPVKRVLARLFSALYPVAVLASLVAPAGAATPPFSATLAIDSSAVPTTCPATIKFKAVVSRPAPDTRYFAGNTYLQYRFISDDTYGNLTNLTFRSYDTAVSFSPSLKYATSHGGWAIVQLAQPYQKIASNKLWFTLTCAGNKAILTSSLVAPTPTPSPTATPHAPSPQPKKT